MDDIRKYTAQQFDSINFNELNDRWIDDVIDNDFVDAEENTMTTNILFVHDPLPTLIRLSEVCDAWYQKTHRKDCSNYEASAAEAEVLWTYLDEMDISVKQLLGMIYLLCYQVSKQSSTFEVKQLGLGSAKLYFSCLKLPGSTAYSVFHPNLFKLCLDTMIVPDIVSENKNSYSWKDFEKLLPLVVSTLESLIPLISTFYLGDDSSTTEYMIKKLVELASCEISSANLNFELNFMNMNSKERKRYSQNFQVASLAYQGLSALVNSDINGNSDCNYSVILSHLNHHILCYKVKKCQTFPQKFNIIKDNAVNFICYNLNVDKNFYSKLTLIALKRLCLSVIDKTDFRSIVSNAVYKIMYNLTAEDLADMIKWLLLLTDSSDSKDRSFSLDILGHLLSGNQKVDTEHLPPNLKAYFTEVPIIFSVLTRCDDISPAVRTKALSILSQCMECILEFLEKTKNETTFIYEEDESLHEKDIDINGDHRIFWYKMKSYRDRLNEIASLLHRRIEDNNCNTRKAALQALENVIVFDAAYLRDDHMKLFMTAAKDGVVIIRKQMIQSLTAILDAYYETPLAHEYWLKCILPLIHDPENSVEQKVLSVMEDYFLHKIFSSKDSEQECVFDLLTKLSETFLPYQRYLQKAFSSWKKEKKLRSQMILPLEKYFEASKEHCVWFYVSIFASYCKLPLKMCIFIVEQFQKYQDSENYPQCMEYIIKVIGYQYNDLPEEKLQDIYYKLKEKLMNFNIPVEFIQSNVDILYKIGKRVETEDELSSFCAEIVKKCAENITLLFKKEPVKRFPTELEIAKCLCTMKEFCQICPTCITQNNIQLLKALSGHNNAICKFSPGIQAHAVAALGKICLQDELLAKELLPTFAKELVSSKQHVIRSNVVIIMIEMCKRYTSFADKYVPLISLCFKDKLYIIRFQAISLLIGLLQEEYIKWRGALFFCLLSTVLDKNESIRELGKYCLIQLEEKNGKKRKSVFADHFVDSIFVFNNYAPPDNDKLAQIVKEMERFSLKGEDKRSKRMLLYNFILEYMPISNCAFIVRQLCEEILMSVADAVFPLNKLTESMVRDCFAILNFKVVRGYAGENDAEDVEDIAKIELEARRLIFVAPVIPVIISLKNCVTECKSKLITDIIIFLKEILHDFKHEVNQLLAEDKMLLRQVQLELKNETMQLEKEAKEKSKKDNGEQSEITGPPRGPQITARAKDISNYLWQKEKIPENVNTRKTFSQASVSSTRTGQSTQQMDTQEMNSESTDKCNVAAGSTVRSRIRYRHANNEVTRVYSDHSDDQSSPPKSQRQSMAKTYENMSVSEEEMIRLASSSSPQVILTPIKLPFVPDVNNINSIDIKSLSLSDKN